MNKVLTSVLAAALIALFFTSCFDQELFLRLFSSDDDSPTGPGSDSSYVNATITHWGFDFSAGKNDTTNWGENNDGETIVWSPIGEWSNQGIWFRTRVYPNRTQSLGAVDITSITTIDTVTAAWDTQPPPLSLNSVVVAQCLDGFVKFQVVADVDTSAANVEWAVQVRYLFSEILSFNE